MKSDDLTSVFVKGQTLRPNKSDGRHFRSAPRPKLQNNFRCRKWQSVLTVNGFVLAMRRQVQKAGVEQRRYKADLPNCKSQD